MKGWHVQSNLKLTFEGESLKCQSCLGDVLYWTELINQIVELIIRSDTLLNSTKNLKIINF